MAIRRTTSTETARRFLGERYVPENWCFAEKHVPGCYTAWQEQVGLPSDGFQPGITGKPTIVIAADRRCYQTNHDDCQCRSFENSTWSLRPHQPLFPVVAAAVPAPKLSRAAALEAALEEALHIADRSVERVRHLVSSKDTSRERVRLARLRETLNQKESANG